MSTVVLTLPVSQVAVSQGRAVTTATVSNTGEVAQSIVLGVFAPQSAPPLTAPAPAVGWTTVERPKRSIAPGATEQFSVTFAPPEGTSAGSYPVRLIAYSAEGAPEESSDQARQLDFVVAGSTVVPPPPHRWWIYVVAAALVIIVGAVAFVLLTRDGPTPTPSTSTSTSTSPATSAAPIVVEDISWTLTGFRDGATITPWTPTPKTITLRAEGQVVSGSTGCNQYKGQWGRNGNEVGVKGISTTLILCGQPARDQEQRFLAYLRDVQTVNGGGSTIELATADGRALVFQQ